MNYIKSNVITIGIGMCASMAAFLLSSGNKRCALKNTEIMIHQPLGGAQGQATEIQKKKVYFLELKIKLKEKINTILSKNTKKPLSKIKKDVERDYYMSSNEALNYGLIDKII